MDLFADNVPKLLQEFPATQARYFGRAARPVCASSSHKNPQESKTMITQALVVRLPDRSLALDRGIWFNEVVRASCAAGGAAPDLYDGAADWLGDPEECPEETWSYDRALLAIDKS